MSGAVSNITKTVAKPINKMLGRERERPSSSGGLQVTPRQAEAPAAQPPLAAPSAPAARAAEEAATQAAVTRRARRRGGRTLLSEARLNPELGVGQSTLGVGPM